MLKSNAFGDGKMNGFAMMSDSYRKLIEQGKIEKEIAEKEIRIYDFLATCTDDDFCRMIDSTAFNEIIRTFCRKAIRNAKVDEDERMIENAIMNELRWLFDEKTAKEVLEYY